MTAEALVARGFRPEEAQALLNGLGREPNPVEEALFRVLWSEHCSYKHTKELLRRLPSRGEAVAVGPGQNAGVLRIGGGYALAVKVESHNHPSAVEPFQGAATGVGGILRDVLATGARPIAFLDALFLGADEGSRFHREGVVAGIAHYGNSVGVPTVGGEWHEEEAYAANPLVNCMCAGLVREDELLPSVIPEPGLALVLLGAATGRDGIAGAAFASERLSGADDEHRVEVQVGDPFLGKLLVEATLALHRRRDLVGLGDLGAAGLTSAAAEMAARGGVGVRLDLDRVTLREAGLGPAEILLSESQERMLLVVRPERTAGVLEVARRHGLPAAVIGVSTDDGRFVAKVSGEVVVDVPAGLLAGGCPPAPLAASAVPEPPEALSAEAPTAPGDLEALWEELLRRRPPGGPGRVWRRYDWSVGVRTVLGPGHDAAVLRIWENGAHVALVTKSAPRAARGEPRRGAALAVAWAATALAAVGATPLGITDGLNFGDPDDPGQGRVIAETVAGLAEACEALGLPVVSGNVSLYNSSPRGPVWPTAVVGGVGVVPPGGAVGRSRVAQAGMLLVLAGAGVPTLEGSLAGFLARGGREDRLGRAPSPELAATRALVAFLATAWREGLVVAAHTVDEGGLLLALAQMTAAGGVGFETVRPLSFLEAFGEGGGRAALALPPEREGALRALARVWAVPVEVVARTTAADAVAWVGEAKLSLRGRGTWSR